MHLAVLLEANVMRIDVNALSHHEIREAVKKVYGSEHAQRLGRKAAFDDIERKGFCHAYEQAEVVDWMHKSALSEFWDRSSVSYFHIGYRQVVIGYYMLLTLPTLSEKYA